MPDAAQIFSQGAAEDVASKDADRAANKLVALAYTAACCRTRKGAAVTSAEKALAASHAAKIRFLAARVLLEAGAAAKARR